MKRRSWTRDERDDRTTETRTLKEIQFESRPSRRGVCNALGLKGTREREGFRPTIDASHPPSLDVFGSRRLCFFDALAVYFFAYESVMLCVGLILNPCSPESATALRVSESNSTKAMPGFASTMRTSANPGNCWNSIESIDAVVASVRSNRIESRATERGDVR